MSKTTTLDGLLALRESLWLLAYRFHLARACSCMDTAEIEHIEP